MSDNAAWEKAVFTTAIIVSPAMYMACIAFLYAILLLLDIPYKDIPDDQVIIGMTIWWIYWVAFTGYRCFRAIRKLKLIS